MKLEKLILKFVWESIRPRISKIILKKRIGELLTLLDAKAYNEAIK